MGDYSKIIVSCEIKREAKEELLQKLENFKFHASAYQSDESIISIKENAFNNRSLNVILVGQRKWGDGINDFCTWLRPHVVQGSGENDVFAMEFSEYCTRPVLYTRDITNTTEDSEE